MASHAPVLLPMVLLNGIAALSRNLYRRFANSSCGKSFFEVSLDFSNQFRTVAYWDYFVDYCKTFCVSVMRGIKQKFVVCISPKLVGLLKPSPPALMCSILEVMKLKRI